MQQEGLQQHDQETVTKHLTTMRETFPQSLECIANNTWANAQGLRPAL